MTLSRNDLSVIEGEARVTCRRLAGVLGFARHDHLIRLVKARRDELEDFGPIFLFEEEKSGRGRRKRTYLFNEHQAVAICMWAETSRAREARMQIVEVFVAWRRGDLHGLAAQKQQAQDVFAESAMRSGHAAAHLANIRSMDDLVNQVAYLPIWPSGKRPRWWHDLEVREFLTRSHRQMGNLEAERMGKSRYGDRCPGKTTINQYWQRLDRVFGLPPWRVAGAAGAAPGLGRADPAARASVLGDAFPAQRLGLFLPGVRGALDRGREAMGW